MKRSAAALVSVATVAAVALAYVVWHPGSLPPAGGPLLPRAEGDPRIARGAYLARVGGCIACHSATGSPELAGQRAILTPYGSLYTPNITPDEQAGIGTWTPDEFYRVLHTGIARDGSLMYPAMPFASFTKITREDADAIYAFLMSVPPATTRNRPHDLRFPFAARDLLVGWRTLEFREGEYVADPGRPAQWNRGAYLVQAFGRCATCHTPPAIVGSPEARAFHGAMVPNDDWYAPSLAAAATSGLGNWSTRDIADFLQSGVSSRGSAYGPMAGVVAGSLQYLDDADAEAIAVYLKALPPHDTGPSPASREPSATAPPLVMSNVIESGRVIYGKLCAECHREDGRGQPPAVPPLAGNASITMAAPVNPIRIVLSGGSAPVTRRNPQPTAMPPFARALSDAQVAAIVSYIRMEWGNAGSPVSTEQVGETRRLVRE